MILKFGCLPIILILCGIYLTDGQKIQELSLDSGDPYLLKGSNATLYCKGEGTELQWEHRKKNMTLNPRWNIETIIKSSVIESRVFFRKIGLKENGTYKCIVIKDGKEVEEQLLLYVEVPPKLQEVTNASAQVGAKASLKCTAKASPIPKVTWLKGSEKLNDNKRYIIEENSESSLYLSELLINNAQFEDNGTYQCIFENKHGKISGNPIFIIHDIPVVSWVTARSIGPEEVHLKWKFEDNNSPINYTEIVVLLESEGEMQGIPVVPPTTTSKDFTFSELGLENLDEGIEYLQVFVRLSNAVGVTESELKNITMLKKKPIFRPVSSLKVATTVSLSVSWSRPEAELIPFIDGYKLSLTNTETDKNIMTLAPPLTYDHLFTELEHGTTYSFTVSACLNIEIDGKENCGPSSEPVAGRTMSQPPARILDVFVQCYSNRSTGKNDVFVRWEQEMKNDSKVDKFKIDLISSADFVNQMGRADFVTDQVINSVASDLRNYTFQNVQPNTNYTVKVYAGTKSFFSSPLVSNCEMPIWTPEPAQLQWWKTTDNGVTVLKMPTPFVSQRNGTICCYRVVVVRLSPDQTIKDLPHPSLVKVSHYSEAYKSGKPGAYVAEAFARHARIHKYLLIGDGKTTKDDSEDCFKCLGVEPSAAAQTANRDGSVSDGSLPYTRTLRRRSPDRPTIAQDDFLSKKMNYTGFLALTVRDRNGTSFSSYSDYFNVIQPTDDLPGYALTTPSSFNNSITHVVYILGSLIAILGLMAVTLAFLLCHYHRKRKQLIDDGTDESLSGSLGRIFRTLRRSHTLMSQPSIDVKPIAKEDLVPTYLEKLKDSELGFRREFEALPEKFFDRTSRASDMSDNSTKNRYPDIKSYDQTRVKLSQINGIVASSYINANYVMGYKERKKFICAQGPMDSTVNDFWRMIVEQRCGICIMLTNLEENGKVKCVKYWPEAGEPKKFGNITVRLIKEKPYADYVIRTLRAEWPANLSPNSSQTENCITSGTSTTKSNTSGSNNSNTNNSTSNNDTSANTNNPASDNSSNYNSLSSTHSRSTSDDTKFHEIQQYHYLMWKDFIAPEHPVGVLAFLRRINEAYAPDMGPLLVHCSAGVGRTGTLVALDALVTEVEEEKQASIFNQVQDLRHQRNFLVQSLKQYVFVHRALMEYAQFGNTEQTVSQIKESLNLHAQKVALDEKSDLEKQFERLAQVVEDRKAFTVANHESNKAKNRYDFVLPYDTNCVILSPLPTQIGQTYINASFVGGFDLGESFIVTQDPLENTITDFWRMVYEQEVNTLVMLSELGSGEELCNRYWPEDESIHEHVTVKFIASESYPKYNTRIFNVTNTKSGDTITVTQFQYVGWSGNIGEVPLVTQGIMEIISRVQSHKDANMQIHSPVLVHCSGGGDRSSVYVCLSNCLRQLRREGKVDVFQMSRKVRSQRQFMLQDFSQYEFTHKALVEYVDLKGGDNL